ncbi:MAG: P13 family porin [Spirochaetia bacterium]|nr:P13 family porin [Spirochaetia bacterium]
MKKLLLFTLILLILDSNIFAANNNNNLKTEETNNVQEINNHENYIIVSRMLSKTKKAEDFQIDLIEKLSINFNENEKDILYDANKKKILLPFLVNTIVGHGIGSFIQGDIKGGTLSISGELTYFFIISIGFCLSEATDEKLGNPTMLVGVIGLVASKIYQMIRPFYYASNYNNKLSESLNYVAIKPSISTDKKFSLNLSYKIPL